MILDKRKLKNTFNLGTEIKDYVKYFYFKERYWVFLVELSDFLGIVLLQQHFQLVMITPTLAYPVVFTLENVLIVGDDCNLGFIFTDCRVVEWVRSLDDLWPERLVNYLR
jgi:lipoprotein-releasing system permease protein